MCAMRSATASAKPTGALRPVPTAVPPWASAMRAGSVASIRSMPFSTCCDVAGEFLAERERRRVLRVRAADLDDVCEGLRLVVQRVAQLAAAPGAGDRTISSAPAMCIAVGKVSFEDWLMLTWSFGWTGVLRAHARRRAPRSRGSRSPRSRSCWTACPSRSARRRAGTGRRACPRRPPGAALTTASATVPVELAESLFATAAACLTMPSACTTALRHALPADLEVLDRALRLRAPDSGRAGTSIGPNVSVSVRVAPVAGRLGR